MIQCPQLIYRLFKGLLWKIFEVITVGPEIPGNLAEVNYKKNGNENLSPLVTPNTVPISIHGVDGNDKVHMTPTPPNTSTPSTTIQSKNYHTKRELTSLSQQQATDLTGVTTRLQYKTPQPAQVAYERIWFDKNDDITSASINESVISLLRHIENSVGEHYSSHTKETCYCLSIIDFFLLMFSPYFLIKIVSLTNFQLHKNKNKYI